MRRLTLGAAAAAMLLVAPLPLSAQRVVERAEQLSDTYERIRAGQESRDRLPRNIVREVADLERRLEAHLRDHPDDVRALIAAARMAHTRVLLTPVTWSPAAGESPPDNQPVAAHAMLTRAMTLAPDNAEVHYWQARLYGIRHAGVRDGLVVNQPEDINQAIDHARRAMELMPAERRYRDALTQYLIDDQRFDDAIELLREVDGGTHPVYLLLRDAEAVPLPEGAVYSARESRSFGEFLVNRNRFDNHPFLRTRVYVFRGPVADIQAFYRDSFPTLRMFDAERPGASEKTLFFRTVDGGIEPSNERMGAAYQENWLWLTIHEISDPDEAARRRYDLSGEGPFCVIYLINMRSVN